MNQKHNEPVAAGFVIVFALTIAAIFGTILWGVGAVWTTEQEHAKCFKIADAMPMAWRCQ